MNYFYRTIELKNGNMIDLAYECYSDICNLYGEPGTDWRFIEDKPFEESCIIIPPQYYDTGEEDETLVVPGLNCEAVLGLPF